MGVTPKIYLQQKKQNMTMPKCVLFALFKYSSQSYIILASTSAVINLPNKMFIFHDFPEVAIKYHDFPGLENEFIKCDYFTGFP